MLDDAHIENRPFRQKESTAIRSFAHERRKIFDERGGLVDETCGGRLGGDGVVIRQVCLFVCLSIVISGEGITRPRCRRQADPLNYCL